MNLHVDLCAGNGGWQRPFQEHGWRTVGVDVRPMDGTDVLADVQRLPLDCSPTLVTASPPCREFARWMLPWHDEPDPDLSLVRACLDAVDVLDPDWWVLENSRGLHQYWRPAATHYGPFYLWGEFPTFDIPTDWPAKESMSGDAPDERAEIPYGLANGLRKSIEMHTNIAYE